MIPSYLYFRKLLWLPCEVRVVKVWKQSKKSPAESFHYLFVSELLPQVTQCLWGWGKTGGSRTAEIIMYMFLLWSQLSFVSPPVASRFLPLHKQLCICDSLMADPVNSLQNLQQLLVLLHSVHHFFPKTLFPVVTSPNLPPTSLMYFCFILWAPRVLYLALFFSCKRHRYK